MNYVETFLNGYSNYAGYLFKAIKSPHLNNYFYWLIGVSLVFFILEVVIPWRKNQKTIRKDFWLDAFYMFFNFFLFSLIIYNAASDVVVKMFNDGIMALSGFDLQANNPLRHFPMWGILIIGFIVRDFVQWWIHRLLHYSDWLWKFHKVHHSVEEMGFAAHLRYHWMENVVYRSLEYIPLALLGIGLYDFFIIHIFTLSWGHYNHSNISVDGKWTGSILGFLIGICIAFSAFDFRIVGDNPDLLTIIGVIALCTAIGFFLLGRIMKYIFNHPEMHIWHHSHDLPEDRRLGINFGLTLSVWDYIFKTAYVPFEGRDIKLGFPGVENFPDSFIEQIAHGIVPSSKEHD